jgi:hypothetical protein
MKFEDSMSRIDTFGYSKNLFIFLHKILLFEKLKNLQMIYILNVKDVKLLNSLCPINLTNM